MTTAVICQDSLGATVSTLKKEEYPIHRNVNPHAVLTRPEALPYLEEVAVARGVKVARVWYCSAQDVKADGPAELEVKAGNGSAVRGKHLWLLRRTLTLGPAAAVRLAGEIDPLKEWLPKSGMRLTPL